MAAGAESSEDERTMKKKLIALLLAVAVNFALIGCANTAEGIKQDYKKAEDKI